MVGIGLSSAYYEAQRRHRPFKHHKNIIDIFLKHSANMEAALAKFPNGLPTLEQIREHNKGSDVPPETAWIWGDNDEV